MRNRLTCAFWLATLMLGPLPALAADPDPIEIAVTKGQVSGGAKVIRLKRDDPVTLTVRADQADELHVHGYNLHADIVPGKPSTLKFIAKRTGRFSLELHKSGVELGTLEIYPK
jgi:heme/copper-type cytochrome/quinol oxidase subunit 2